MPTKETDGMGFLELPQHVWPEDQQTKPVLCRRCGCNLLTTAAAGQYCMVKNPAAGPWIPVAERMPEEGAHVLVRWDEPYRAVSATFKGGKFLESLMFDEGEELRAFYWAELYEPKGAE